MQVNKRSGEDIDHPDAKRISQKETSVAEAALKYDTPDQKGADKKGNNQGEDSKDANIAIDSELLSHQSGSFEHNETDDQGKTNDNSSGAKNEAEGGASSSNAGNNGDERTHAHLSEQLTNYNALSNDSPNDSPNARGSNEDQAQSQSQQQHQEASNNATQQSPSNSNTSQQSPEQPSTQILHQSSEKPLAGSDEWHRIRKDNHKEVERRRRENINSGIKELAGLLPTQDTNKSQILQRAIEYIKRLKENENNNIEKWTLEKLLTDQAIAELTASNEKLKAELERAYREVEHWKKASSAK